MSVESGEQVERLRQSLSTAFEERWTIEPAGPVLGGSPETALQVQQSLVEHHLRAGRRPMGRTGQPVARVTSLASPRCSFSTGSALDISGQSTYRLEPVK